MKNLFNKLKFNSHPVGLGNKQAIVFFPNGYGASVVLGDIFYSDGVSTYELAVIKGNEENFEIQYDTPVTDDVIGYATETEINDLLKQIKEL